MPHGKRPPVKKTSKNYHMQLKFFTITVDSDEETIDDLNRFLRSVKVLEIKKEFVNQPDGGSFWSVCVTYLPQATDINSSRSRIQRKIDYKEVLTSDEFEVFSKLRKIRKLIAEKDAVPPFAVFSDAELAEIVKLEKIDIESVSKIDGIGKKKVEKYAIDMLRMLNEGIEVFDNEKNG